ncbi:MAG TPA: hypothetical protein VMF06_04275 [Candidatus Limnocylindria bacterium]|nr:hypothetical protein [Candidatus Limnocylindria bacterium]
MKTSIFRLLLVLLLVAGAAAMLWQRRTWTRFQSERHVRIVKETPGSPVGDNTDPGPSPTGPGLELVRLRGEVAALRREVETHPTKPLSFRETINEWATLWPGPKPSQLAGYQAMTNVQPVGFASPGQALQTFFHAFQNQTQAPFDRTRMKELWDVPDDFDSPDTHYDIHLGQGFGGEVGYRVTGQEELTPGKVKLKVDFEKRDGSYCQREMVMVDHGGHWRLQPLSVTLSNLSAADESATGSAAPAVSRP